MAPAAFDEIPEAIRDTQQGFALVDAIEGAIVADAWAVHEAMAIVLAAAGSSGDQLLRQHIWQQDKRYFPIYENIRMHCQPDACPSSGLGIDAFIGPGSRWYGVDGIAVGNEPGSPFSDRIVVTPEVPDPHHLQIRLWVDGELRVNYNTDDLAHSIPESIAWASAIESFSPGDLFFIGTNHQGLGPMQEGDNIDVEVERVGRFSFQVTDPLQRRWLKGVDELTAQDIREGTGPPGSRQRPL